MDTGLLVVVVIIIIVFAAKLTTRLKTPTKKVLSEKILHKKRATLCTANEKKFFYALQLALDNEYLVHCQTSLIALVEPLEFRYKSKAWSKRVDFVITDKTTKVLAVIELDDASHQQKKRIARDQYINEALLPHHPLLRIPTKNYYDPAEIAKLLKDEANIASRGKEAEATDTK